MAVFAAILAANLLNELGYSAPLGTVSSFKSTGQSKLAPNLKNRPLPVKTSPIPKGLLKVTGKVLRGQGTVPVTVPAVNIPVPTVKQPVTSLKNRQIKNKKAGKNRRKKQNRQNLGRAINNNPYLDGLLDPAGKGRGAKAPDSTTLPTGTWQWSADFSISSADDGGALVIVNPWNIINSGGNTAAASTIVTTNSSASSTMWGLGTDPLSSAVTNPSVETWAARIRPINACIELWSTKAPTAIEGLALSTIIPSSPESGFGAKVALISTANLAAQAYNSIKHASVGATAKWIPSDNSEFEFEDVIKAADSANWKSGLGFSSGALSKVTGTTIAAAIAGPAGTHGAILYQCRVVINYEFIPSSDVTSFVTTTPSPVNKSWVETAQRVVSENSDMLFTKAAELSDTAVKMAANAALGYVTNQLRAPQAPLRRLDLR